MKTWDLAVDIGVTTVVAAVRDDTGVELATFGGRPALPALVRCSDGAPQAGVSLADDQLDAVPGTILLSPKRLMVSGTAADGRDFPAAAPELYAAILLTVTEAAAAGRDAGIPDRLILTYPASWTEDHLEVLRDAAAAAHLPDPEFIAEPLAAACYLGTRNTAGQILAVLDVGDGSVDAAVLRRTPDGFKLIGSPGSVARTSDDHLDVSARRAIYELLATISAAGLSSEQLADIYVTGGASGELRIADLTDQILGVAARLDPDPCAVMVLGALNAEPDPPAAEGPARHRLAPGAVIRTAIIATAITLVAVAGALVVHRNLAEPPAAAIRAAKQLPGRTSPASQVTRRTPAESAPASSTAPTPSPDSPAPSPASPTPTPVPSGSPEPPASPAAVVESYFAAINAHDYLTAWRLGGYHFASDYAAFTVGYKTTEQDIVTITSVAGNNVTAELTAVQYDGTRIVYEGTYVTENGLIVSASVKQLG